MTISNSVKVSAIRLFKALPIASSKTAVPSREVLEITLPKGFVFSPEVLGNYPDYAHLITLIEKEVGLSPEKLNQTFHKSWIKIRDAKIELLVMEQLIHYLTTYGFEDLGIFSNDSVFIPREVLEIPALKPAHLQDGVSLVVIKGYTKAQLKEKVLGMLKMGVALSEDTLKDVMEIAHFVEFNAEDILLVKNKEAKVKFYDEFKIVPSNPTEFMRYAIQTTIGNSLLIKSKATIGTIKQKAVEDKKIADLFARYRDNYGIVPLSTIFLRFKPIFLAFRANKSIKPMINKIRRLAKANHKPMAEDYLNAITGKIKRGLPIDQEKLLLELGKANIFRKIRLAYALKYRTSEDADSILYKVRNGKGYATEFSFTNKKDAQMVLDTILKSIAQDISKKVKGKRVYIPEHITYTLPATEKQFSGNFPNGTHLSVKKDIIFGVHWENIERKDGGSEHSYYDDEIPKGEERIDLDLSLYSPESGKVGWDGLYRTGEKDVLFSGDITNAPRGKGATELFYIQKQHTANYIVMLNNFNRQVDVPFKIIVASEKPENFGKNYMVNPNNVVCIGNSSIKDKQKIVGLVVTNPTECKFYFAETDIGNSASASGTKFVLNSRKYLINFYKEMITLNDVLEKAGAILTTEKDKCEIDLSPDKLEKDTILSLITKS